MNGKNEIDEDDDDEFFDIESPTYHIESLDESTNCLNSLKPDLNELKPIYAVQYLNCRKTESENRNGFSFESDDCRIFLNRENAMKLCKVDPENRRFKVFKSLNEAYAFSYESSESETGKIPSLFQIQVALNLNDLQNSPKDSREKACIDAEKLPFSGPKKPEINELRLFIERNNIEAFKSKVLSNPRFLISAGDTPIAVQESFRYNCLHVCAKENRSEICEFVLNTLNNVSFIQKLYRSDSLEQSRSRCHHLLDLYMNMPEKGFNETPLHFACKYGSLEVARLMMSYDVCLINLPNKYGKTPEDLICSKAVTQIAKDNSNAIKSLFEDCLYVPVYRDDEKGDVSVDKPSPKLVTSINSNLTVDIKSANFSPSSSISNHFFQNQKKLAAFVGPISPTYANAIYERLKSPARLRQSPNNLDILRSDDYKGYERIIRKLTDEMNLPWQEYWEFLGSYCNFKTNEGISKLESYLEQKQALTLIEIQNKTVKLIKDEFKDKVSSYTDQNEFVQNLEKFLEISDELKKILSLKENSFSPFYEKFSSAVKDCLKSLPTESLTLPLQLQKNILDLDEEELKIEKINEEILNKTLVNYMSLVIELSKQDKSTRCYFNLYKTSKNLLNLLNCQIFFESFYLSPLFKRTIAEKQKPMDKKLLENANKKLQKLNRNKKTWNQNDIYQMRKVESDQEDEADEDDDDDYNDSYVDDEYDDSDNQNDDLDIKGIKINSGFDEIYKAYETTTTKHNDSKYEQLETLVNNMRLQENFDSTKENFSVFKKTEFFKNKSMQSERNETQKLFMFGDTPSKLDRAVYFAIQDVKIDFKNYPLLNEWFNFMKTCNKNEMHDWKSPMKKPLKSRFFNL